MADSKLRLALAKQFGVLLHELRLKRGLSLSKLGRASGLDMTFIHNLEHGKRQPTLTTIFALAKALGTRGSTILRKLEGSVSASTRKKRPGGS